MRGRRATRRLDRKSTWLGVPEFLPMHTYMQTTIFAFHARCTLGATWNSSVKAMEQLKGPLTVRRRVCGARSLARSLACSLFQRLQRGTKVYSRDATAATATQRKRCFVNAKSFPLIRNRILTDSHVWFLYTGMYERSTIP